MRLMDTGTKHYGPAPGSRIYGSAFPTCVISSSAPKVCRRVGTEKRACSEPKFMAGLPGPLIIPTITEPPFHFLQRKIYPSIISTPIILKICGSHNLCYGIMYLNLQWPKWSICRQAEGGTTFSLFCHMLSHWFSGRDQCFRLPKMSRKVTLQHLFISPTPFPQLIPSEIYNKCLACIRMRLAFFSKQCRTLFSYPGWFDCNFLPKTMYFKHHINLPWE